MKEYLSQTLAEVKETGLYREEQLTESMQQATITVKGKEMLNFYASNYLGLSNHPRLIKASQEMMERCGFGMSSVRFVCGAQDIYKEPEAAISDYSQTEGTILYAACFDASGGVFEPLFSEEDVIISDSLNHASIVDGTRLYKAKRHRYANADTKDLEGYLQEAQAQRFRVVVTGGVFSMDGNVAPMDQVCDLAEKYDALVMVDESHSAGVVGATDYGVSELYKTYGHVGICTGTLNKTFGGALGELTTGREEIIDLLHQRSRSYLFSNSLALSIIGASLEIFRMLEENNALRDRLVEDASYFHDQIAATGSDIKPTQSTVCAVMLYDAKLSQIYAARIQEEGIYVTGFYCPVVPEEQARIRVQISAGHEKAYLDKCITALIKVGKEPGTLR